MIVSSPTFGGTGCPGNGPTNSHVVAEYIFQEGGGTTTINSGTDSEAGDATLVNGAAFSTDVPPANNNCGWSVNLPSQGSGATTPAVETDANYDPLSGATSFTIMAWVKRESAASNNNTSARIVSDTSALTSGSGFEFRFSGSAGTLALRINGNELSTTVGGIAPNSNTWHHVAVVYDGTRPATNALTRHAHFYVDGIQRGLGVSNATLNVTVAANTNKLTIGNSAVSRGVGNLLVGKIDDVRILRGFAPDAVGDGKTNDVILCYLNRADDFEPPTIICPPDVTVQADPGQSYATNVPLGGPQVADNCGMVSVTNDAPAQFPIGVIGVTWTATDAAGNRSSCVQAVTVESSSPPTTDSDGDGLTDWEEINIYGTDPNNPDTDGDGMPDGWEVQHGLNPLVNDANGDLDGDGMPNKWEYDNGLNPNDPTDADQDYDNDGLVNIQEFQHGTLARNRDTDGDGMPDGWEVAYNLNPTNAADANEDLDGDGWSNLREYEQGTQPNNASSAPTPIQPISVTAQYKNWIVNRSKCGYAPFVPTSPPKRYLRRTPYGEYWACYYGTCGDNPGTVPNDGYTVLFGNFAGSARIRFVGGSTWYDPQTCQEFNNAMYIWAYSSGSVCNQPDNCDVCEDSCYVWRGPALWTGAYGIGDGNSFPLQTRTETTLFNAPGQIENVVWHTGNGIILSDEYTTPMFEEITRNQLNAMPEPTQWATGGSALRNLSDDQLNIALRKMKYRFAFQGQNGSGYRLTWVERFTPKGGGNPLDTTKSATVAANGGTQYTSEYEVQPPSNNGTITVVPSLARLEIDGGNIVWDNWDDDNNDGIPDKEEFSSTTFDNDLVPLRIIVGPLENGKQVTLSVTQGADKIRVWTSANKQTLVLGGLQPSKTWTIGVDTIPSTLYVEGINKSSAENDVELKLTYSLANVEASLRLTVVKLNLGAAVYRRLRITDWGLSDLHIPDYNHTGLLTGYTGGRTKTDLNNNNNWQVTEMPGMFSGPRRNTFQQFLNDYQPYHGSYSVNALSDRHRIMILRYAQQIYERTPVIGYPPFGADAIDWEGSVWDGTINDIRNLRCDGLVEVCYELPEVAVWCWRGTRCLIQTYPNEHNDLGMSDPQVEFSPIVQRGGVANSPTSFILTPRFEPNTLW